jgi:hypothetical protein
MICGGVVLCVVALFGSLERVRRWIDEF